MINASSDDNKLDAESASSDSGKPAVIDCDRLLLDKFDQSFKEKIRQLKPPGLSENEKQSSKLPVSKPVYEFHFQMQSTLRADEADVATSEKNKNVNFFS